MRAIDADKLRERMYHDAFEVDSDMQKWDGGCWIRYKMFENAINDAPTVEPVKHGEWEEENTRTRSMKFKCSVCGKIAYYPQNHHSADPKRCGYAYCPNCGARMDGRERR